MNNRIVKAEQKRETLPILGKVKIGDTVEAKSQKGTTYNRPRSLDHFRCTGHYAELFTQAYGEKPALLPIAFLSDNTDEVCRQIYETRDDKGKLVGTFDGETARMWMPDKNLPSGGKYVESLVRNPAEFAQKYDWKEKLRLRFHLPALRNILGIWELTSGAAASSIPSIIASFDGVRQIAGSIVGIPFDMVCKRHTANRPGAVSTYTVIEIIPRLGIEDLVTLREHRLNGGNISAGILTPEKVKALSTGKPIERLQIEAPEPTTADTVNNEPDISADDDELQKEADDDLQEPAFCQGCERQTDRWEIVNGRTLCQECYEKLAPEDLFSKKEPANAPGA